MARQYEAPRLELYGSVTALTASLKCTPHNDTGLAGHGASDRGDYLSHIGQAANQNPDSCDPYINNII